jgi:hypothetical protein
MNLIRSLPYSPLTTLGYPEPNKFSSYSGFLFFKVFLISSSQLLPRLPIPLYNSDSQTNVSTYFTSCPGAMIAANFAGPTIYFIKLLLCTHNVPSLTTVFRSPSVICCLALAEKQPFCISVYTSCKSVTHNSNLQWTR